MSVIGDYEATATCHITVDPVDARDFGRDRVTEQERAQLRREIDAGDPPSGPPHGSNTVTGEPVAEYIAAALEGCGQRGIDAMRALANDDTNGPIHLVRLVIAAEHVAQQFGGTLVSSSTTAAQKNQLVASAVPGGSNLYGLVAELRNGASLTRLTDLVAQMDHEQRCGVLDTLLSYVFAFMFAASHPDPEGVRINLAGSS